MKIILPVIGLCAGILLGIKSGIVLPYAMMAYGGVGILACLDTVLGGVRDGYYRTVALRWRE